MMQTCITPPKYHPSRRITYYVAPSGSSQAAGTFNDPTSLTEAITRIRNLRFSGQLPGGGKIVLRGGRYFLTSTLSLGPQDSGTEISPLILEAHPGEIPILSAGLVISPSAWQTLDDPRLPSGTQGQIVSYSISVAAFDPSTNLTPNTLWHNDQPFFFAQWPTEKWDLIYETLQYGTSPQLDKVNVTKFCVSQDVADLIGPWIDSSAPFLPLVAHGFWGYNWHTNLRPIALRSGREVTLMSGVDLGMRAQQRWRLINVLHNITPGRMCVDTANGRVILWPDRPLGDCILAVGDYALIDGSDCNFVYLYGLKFEGGRRVLLNLTRCRSWRIRNCTFVGGRTALAATGLYDSRIERNKFFWPVRSGIEIRGSDNDFLSLIDHNLVIAENIFRHVRWFFVVTSTASCSARLGWVTDPQRHKGFLCKVAFVRNLLEDSPSGGVQVLGQDVRVSHNVARRLLRESGDAGVFYAGREWVLRDFQITRNVIYDIGPLYTIVGGATKGNYGVYVDDTACKVSIIGNIIGLIRPADYEYQAGVEIGGGRGNVVCGNVILGVRRGVTLDNRGATSSADTQESAITLGYLRTNPDWLRRYPDLSDPINLVDQQQSFVAADNVIRDNVGGGVETLVSNSPNWEPSDLQLQEMGNNVSISPAHLFTNLAEPLKNYGPLGSFAK